MLDQTPETVTMPAMRAHLLQMNIEWENRDANHRLVESMLDTADVREGDLVVLPELFDSGFSLNTALTKDKDGATLRFLLDLADDLGVMIHGSRTVLSCDCNKATNRATIVAPGERVVLEYSKIHPFSYGREGEAFMGGDTVDTYEWTSGEESLRVCPAVCYDLRFPELFRKGLSLGAEAFVLGANWPDARQAHWRALTVARAIENQAFVLAVNRTGPDPHLNYIGGSIALDPKGDVIGELTDEEAVLTVDLDAAHLRAWRDQFPAWRDAKL